MSARTRLLVLVGPKGAGKTSIGRCLGERTGVLFVEVEAVARRVLDETGGVIDDRYAERAFEAIFDHVCERASGADTLVIETTGAAAGAGALIDRLATRFDVALIRITASTARCDERIASRDQTRQIQVDSAMVHAMFERTAALEWAWASTVDNDGGRSIAEIAAEIEMQLAKHAEA